MKHAAYCGTRGIYGDMESSAKSLVSNSDVDKIWFLIEDPEFPRPLPQIVECVDVSGQEFFKPGGPNMKSGFTYMAMMRAALALVPELQGVDKILSLDCDVFAVRDVSGIWDYDLDGYYFAAFHEWHRSGNGLLYCNAGVMLFNLDKLRDGKAEECVDVLNAREYTWVDQDVLSYLCQGRILDIPSWYNSNYWTDKGKDPNPRIVHYAGKKREEWHSEEAVRFYAGMPWEEALDRHGA